MKNVLLVHKFVASWIALLISMLAVLYRLIGHKFDTLETDLLLLQKYTSNVACVIAGNYSNLTEKSQDEFIWNFTCVADRVENYLSSPFVEKPYSALSTLRSARDSLSRLRLMSRNCFVRKQPFGIIIGGPPGSGKTFGLQKLCTDLYKLDHEECRMDDTVILNEGDQFQSEFQTHHEIVIFDDLGATKVDYSTVDPYRKVIDFINNVPKTALNPHLDLKGTVWIEPHIVGATTNLQLPFVEAQQKNTDSLMCPDAINRRFKLMVWQTGYDEFYIVPPGRHNYDKDGKASFCVKSPLTYEQLFVIAKEKYLAHVKEQHQFLQMTKTLHKESKQILSIYAIVAFQQWLRTWIGTAAQDDIVDASILVMVRRFLAVPLQDLKKLNLSVLRAHLYKEGMSYYEIGKFLEYIQQTPKYYYRGFTLLQAKNFDDLIKRSIAVLVPLILKGIETPIYYDMASVVVPAVTSKITKKYVKEEDVRAIANKSYHLLKDVSTYVYTRLGSSLNLLSTKISSWYKSIRNRGTIPDADDDSVSHLFPGLSLIDDNVFVDTCLETVGVDFNKDEFEIIIFDNAVSINGVMFFKDAKDTEVSSPGTIVPSDFYRDMRNGFKSDLKAEGKILDYVKTSLDVAFVEACFESLGKTSDEDFTLMVFQNAIVLDGNPFGKVPVRVQDLDGGLEVSVDDYRRVRDDFYARTHLKSEAKTLDYVAYEMSNKVSRNKLHMEPRPYPFTDSDDLHEEFDNGNCTIIKYLQHIGGIDSNHFVFLPRVTMHNRTLKKGKVSVLYSKKTQLMYVFVPMRQNRIEVIPQEILDVFKDKCTIVAIICSRHKHLRQVVPVYDDQLPNVMPDLINIARYFEIKSELFRGSFAKGISFHFKGFIRKSFDQPICIKNLRYAGGPRRGTNYREAEHSSGDSGDEADCETVTLKDQAMQDFIDENPVMDNRLKLGVPQPSDDL